MLLFEAELLAVKSINRCPWGQCHCKGEPSDRLIPWICTLNLFRHGYWIRLLQTWFKQNDRALRLRSTPAGYVIGGSCCGHGTPVSDTQLEECWEGGILLAECHGGWGRFIKHMGRQFTRFMWKSVGRHVSRLVWRHLNARERRGIMHEPQYAVCQ